MQKQILLSAVCIFNLLHGSSNPKNNVWHTKYKEKPTTQYHLSEYILSRIEFKNDDVVIDIGCGDGSLTSKIATMITEGFIAGIDNNTEMIEQAKEKYGYLSNADFHLGEASRISCNTPCQKVIAINSLSWMPNQRIIYECASSILAADGKFIALVSNAHDPLFQSYNNISKSLKWHSYFEHYIPNFYPSSREDIESHLINTQFTLETIEAVELCSKPMRKKKFIKKLYKNPGFKYCVPPLFYRLFIQDVAQEYLKLTKSPENNIQVICSLFFIIAKKK